MSENARVNVARRIDVKVTASASNAASHKFAVILEIKRKQGFLLTHFSDEAIQVLTLLGAGHKIRRRPSTYRHEREDPSKERALVDEVIEILLRGNRFRILRGVTA